MKQAQLYQYVALAIHNEDIDSLFIAAYDLWRQRLYKAVETGDFEAAREITYRLSGIKEDHKAALTARDTPAE